MFVANITSSRKLLVEARLAQDLRAVADVVARDLRRGGYWENAIAGTVTTSQGQSATANPNSAVTANTTNSTITYSLARDSVSGRSANDNTLDSNEQFGFRLSGGVLQMQMDSGSGSGSGWQSLTDPKLVTVNNFAITPTETVLDIRDSCAKPCAGTGCPTLTVRSYLLQIRGTASSDSSVVRVIQERVRVRNDATAGVCPP